MDKKTNKSRDDYTQEAYMGIRRMFFINEIIPGQKISYRDLAERLAMSPTPIIQALKRLEFQGLVRHEPNRGYYTEKISLEELTEIYEFRELIEVSLLSQTIGTINRQGLARLKKALKNHLNAKRDLYLKERLMNDMELHLTLAELSGRTLQVNTLRHLFDLLYLKYRGNMLFITPMDTVDEEHQRLYDLIAEKEVKQACKVLGEHISNVKKYAVLCLERMAQDKNLQLK
jgi:DNA-binding GntR family transcriptional regulator